MIMILIIIMIIRGNLMALVRLLEAERKLAPPTVEVEPNKKNFLIFKRRHENL